MWALRWDQPKPEPTTELNHWSIKRIELHWNLLLTLLISDIQSETYCTDLSSCRNPLLSCRLHADDWFMLPKFLYTPEKVLSRSRFKNFRSVGFHWLMGISLADCFSTDQGKDQPFLPCLYTTNLPSCGNSLQRTFSKDQSIKEDDDASWNAPLEPTHAPIALQERIFAHNIHQKIENFPWKRGKTIFKK